MKLKIKEGTTSKLIRIFIQDSSSTTGAGLTGLVYNSSGLTAYYLPEGDATATAITLATMTAGTWASGGFDEVDATNMPGVYEVGLPDAVVDATSEGSVLVMLKGATNMAPVLAEIELDAIDYRTGVVPTVTTSVNLTNSMAKYGGPFGVGVYLNDAAANTNTTSYTDGTVDNPVSTIAAAKTIADALSIDRIYLVGNSVITLAATMSDYSFVGIGGPFANSIALSNQTIDNSEFHNLTISGIQAGSSRAYFHDCIFGEATVNCHAYRCGLSDSVNGLSLSNDNDNVLDACYSMVAGNGTPIVNCSGANTAVSFRHYSGGIELKNLNATAAVSVETDGQVVFNATNNVNANVTIRGMATITDNTAGMNNLTTGAAFGPTIDALNDISAAQVNAEVLDVLNVDTFAEPASIPAATSSLIDKISWLFTLNRNKLTQTSTTLTVRNDADGADIAASTVSDDGTTFTRGEYT